MVRDSLPALLAAVAAVLALGVGAATLDAGTLGGLEPGADGTAEPPQLDGDSRGSGDPVGGGGLVDCGGICSLPLSGVPVLPGFGGDSTALLALLVGGAVVAALAAYRATGGDAGPSVESAGEDDADPVVEPAAGAGADPSVTQPSADDEVARAWRALADRLDAPASQSPAEVATAGVDAGLEPDAVAAITDAFRAVRYGGRPVTDERERTAVEARRRLASVPADAAADDPGGDA